MSLSKVSPSGIITVAFAFVMGFIVGILLVEGVVFAQAYSSLKSNVLQQFRLRAPDDTSTSSVPVSQDTEATDRDSEPVDDYSKPVDQDLIDFFGEPLELNKAKFDYAVPPNTDFLKDRISLAEYFFGPSIIGAARYFTSEAQDQKRDELLATAKDKDIEEIVTDVLGIGMVDIGDIESVEMSAVRESAEMEIAYYAMYFTSGAIAQFYVAVPSQVSSTHKIMLALHGCSSSPDKVLGLSEPDYTNSFGYEAAKMGWTVIAPYLLNRCDYIDDFDGLGTISSGSTLYGYEIQKIQSLVDYVTSDQAVDRIDVYGVSFGGQIAMLLAALDERYQNLIVSGAMVYDYHYFYRDYLLNKEGEARVGRFLALIPYIHIDDLLLDFLEDGGEKLVLEVGAYEIAQHSEIDNRETIARFLDVCGQMFGDCNNRVFINFFKGYHETNPQPSLQFILP